MNHSTPAPVSQQNDNFAQDDRREQFLQRILVIAAVLGIVAVIPALLNTDNLILQGIYIGAFVMLVATIVIRLPYLIKAGIFVALPLILGLSSMANAGIHGDSLFFLLAYVILSALLIGPRSGLVAIGLSETVIIVTGYLVLNGHFSLLDPLSIVGGPGIWIIDSVVYLLVSLVVISGLRMLQEGFRQALAQNKTMVDALRESQMELENRVAERTKELVRKTSQLSASAFVARQTAEIQELDKILSSSVNIIAKQFDLYHVGIYLINERGDYAILQAASSEGGKSLLERGHRLRVGTQGIIGLVAAEMKPRIALDVNENTAFLKNPELPKTRSELSLPLVVHNKAIGVLDLQSSETQAFQHEDIDIFQSLADQIAVTIENARLLTESQLVISQLEIASGVEMRQNWQADSVSRKPAYHYSATGLRPIMEATPPKGKNVLEIPLMLRGEKIGKISLQRKDEFQNWTTQEETVAAEVATQTALALENIRLVEQTRQRAERKQAISGIANRIRETLDLDMVLRTSAREIQSTLLLEEAEVRLIPQDEPDETKNHHQVTSS
ncbi:MAG: GAF domain-containing protein [Anaerolineales bacterium]|nr:GAF domain-containing protein [Anaerolineales bacterium]